MLKRIKSRKNVSKVEKYNLVNRFNKEPKTSSFISDFQRVMIERLILNRYNQYHEENVSKIIKNIGSKKYRRNGKDINTDISGGFVLSTEVEADFYILLQEKIKEMTGEYMSMNDFLHLLLTWFYQYYTKPEKNRIQAPMIKTKSKSKGNMVSKFDKRFSKYYQNIMLT